MPKHSKDSGAGRRRGLSKAHFYPLPTTGGLIPGRPPTLSARRREALYAVEGQPYDRDPCPHVLRTRELVPPVLTQAGQVPFLVVGQAVVKTTDAPCVRPSGHVREMRTIPSKHGESVAVPAEDVRLHADAAGRTWS